MTGTGARAQPSFSRLFVTLITSFPRLCLRPEGNDEWSEERPYGSNSRGSDEEEERRAEGNRGWMGPVTVTRRGLSLTRLSRSSPGLIPPLVTLAAQREGREPTGRTRSESGREVSDRHAERRGGMSVARTDGA